MNAFAKEMIHMLIGWLETKGVFSSVLAKFILDEAEKLADSALDQWVPQLRALCAKHGMVCPN